MDKIKHGQSVLLIGNPAAQAEALQLAQSSLTSKVSTTGKVSFEQLDRIPLVNLASSSFHAIVTGSVVPTAYTHSNLVLSKFAKTLAPSGILILTEPVLIDSLAVISIESALHNQRMPFRTERSLLSDLKVNGFINPQLVSSLNVDDDTVRLWASQCWGVGEDSMAQTIDLLLGKVVLVTFSVAKPAYELGAAAPLRFGKKNTTAPAVTKSSNASVWIVSANDDDDPIANQDLEDEDMLLDQDDLKLPSTKAVDCSTKKKACKDCSCGRAEMEALDEASDMVAKITVTTPLKTVTAPVSSCGSCYLGDAFRCSSCPYIGMPAFKPGEKIQLGGNLLKDDIQAL
ncbi:hypothetical protein BATDEDRAFT_35801 [Batrachochytrium dendrobatidis JAM81]|uniref:Uncharacterized protein n=2 Tax=Batrachochytrium dendrobatidis TaxID=109871 RepID=F4P8R0_BATDJ|nr:electron carrier DRE2 [Batrachochytrium dendrobatidis JAM81]EGF78358.1 hypothetical protein BATDEDRAFT_35801 [Batrachochytrium dendrobatidis JAM81]KAJ8330714.1 electron carrier [Batrachochytrium dendrobatidis]KAK5667749.1 electron carrier [Batrachochytrium dendrobatidis]OAJ44495.1 hypothetical protein BDEG_27717 [Batrachochytrium dendrobatidis JEL423]|eukprot:XP_006681161.1 hypothetical protein BATDEDRAFT_35801 [Batrachochytrium dendrobatidis JAM81]